jgi:hypothetical protein
MSTNGIPAGNLRLTAPSDSGPPRVGPVEQAIAAAVAPAVQAAVEQVLAAAEARQAELQRQLTGQLQEVTEGLDRLRAATGVQASTATSQAPVTSPGYYSRQQLAERMAIALCSLDRLDSAGKIGPRAVRPNGPRGRKLYPTEEIESWLNAPRGPSGELPSRQQWAAMRGQQSKGGRRS